MVATRLAAALVLLSITATALADSAIYERSRENPAGLKVRNSPLSFRSMGSGLQQPERPEHKTPNAVLMVAHEGIANSTERLMIQLNSHLARPFEIIIFTQPAFRKKMTEKWGEKLLVTYVDALPDNLDAQGVDRLDTRRYKLWRDYLKVRAKAFNKVMVTDASTVWCQGDPFAFVPDGKIVFSKELRKTLGGHVASRNLLKKIDGSTGSKLLPTIGGHQVISSGVTMGESRVVANYLNNMVTLLKKSAKKDVTLLDEPLIDQAFHNVLLYSEDQMRDDPDHVLHGAFDSPVFTMSTATDLDYALDLTGTVYHKKGKPALVHHYEMHPRLRRMALIWDTLFVERNIMDGTAGFRSNFAESRAQPDRKEQVCF